MIADPICMYDCDIPVDGVATFVFTSAERATDLPHHPVLRERVRDGHARPRGASRCTGRSTTSWTPAFETARRLWEQPGLGPDDVDLPQVYDGFSPFVWFWLEASASARSARRTSSSPTAASTATCPAPCLRCRVAGRSATAACTACPRCSSATSSSRAGPATANGRARRSGWRATARRTSAARWPTAGRDRV